MEALGDMISGAGEFISTVMNSITSAGKAIIEFSTRLTEFDGMITGMTKSISSGSYNGLPIVQSISLYRYLVGDLVFSLTYMVCLFGCLFTIYKLVLILHSAIQDWKSRMLTGSFTSGGFMSALGKFFK